jgi:hypothetical protein
VLLVSLTALAGCTNGNPITIAGPSDAGPVPQASSSSEQLNPTSVLSSSRPQSDTSGLSASSARSSSSSSASPSSTASNASSFFSVDSSSATSQISGASSGLDGGVGDAGFDPTPNYIFLSSASYTGAELGGALGANAKCQTHAEAAGLPGLYVAVLAVNAQFPAALLAASGWVRPDGRPVGNSAQQLIATAGNGEFYATIENERGERDTTYLPTTVSFIEQRYWWGVGENGVPMDCSGWTSPAGDGYAADIGPMYGPHRYVGPAPCAQTSRLLCAGVTSRAQVAVVAVPSRLAFVARPESFYRPTVPAPDGGYLYADWLCAQTAEMSGIAGVFKALLATTAWSATSRFQEGLPWARQDGVIVAQSLQALVELGYPEEQAATLFVGQTPLPDLSSPPYFALQPRAAYTGGAEGGISAPGTALSTCNDWTLETDERVFVGWGIVGAPGIHSWRIPITPTSVPFQFCKRGSGSFYCFQE